MATTRPAGQSYIIKRPRLTKLLDETEARIILLCAPAGYGKTTLVQEWATQVNQEVLWHRLRPTDSDVAAFAAGLAELFTRETNEADNDPVERVRELAVRGLGVDHLARALADAAEGRSATLVLDDYHLAAHSTESESLVHEITRRTAFRMVLTSRIRPPWVTGRSIVYGDVLLVETDQLAFTEEETLEALSHGLNHDDAAIFDIAKGWPAVIGMAAVQGWKGDLSRSLAPRALYEFFAEDLFDSASATLQQNMLLLAAGGDATMGVARALVGEPFDDVFRDARARGFIHHDLGQPLTIHPLLREFLLRRLSEQGETRVKSVVEPVIEQLHESHCWDDCLTTLKRFPNAELISRTMTAAMEHLLAAGRVETVRQWLDLAQDEHINEPIVLLAEAEVALREGRNDHAQALAVRAASSLGSSTTASRAYLTAARAAHLREDVNAAAENAELAQRYGSEPQIQHEALWLAFVSALEAQAPEAEQHLRKLERLDRLDPKLALRVASAKALHAHEHGRTFEAIAVCERAEGLLPHIHDPIQVTGFLHVSAYLAFCAARYERALHLISQLVDNAEAAGLDFPLSYGLVTRASALVSTRRLLAARRTLAELERHHPLNAHVAGNAILCAGKLRIAAGDLEGATTILGVEPPAGSRTTFIGELGGYQGVVYASRGLLTEAETALDDAEAASRYIDTTTTVTLGRAVIALSRGIPDAEAVAAHAVDTVLNTGSHEALVVAARACPQLPRVCARDDRIAKRLTSLFVASHDTTLGRKCGLKMPRETTKGGRLSRREKEVFELVAQGRSTRQIAHTLFISESTAKVHIRHIFEKLGVRSRVELATLALADETSGES